MATSCPCVCTPAFARDSPDGSGKPYPVLNCDQCKGTCTPLHGNALDPIGNAIGAPLKPITDLLDFLNRLWNRALGNPSFWKFAGLIGAGVLAVIVGGIIFMKE